MIEESAASLTDCPYSIQFNTKFHESKKRVPKVEFLVCSLTLVWLVEMSVEEASYAYHGHLNKKLSFDYEVFCLKRRAENQATYHPFPTATRCPA